MIDREESLSIVTVGHVDHGKSTVIGRLLADAGGLPEGKLEMVRENCRRNSKPFEYAFLLDALKNVDTDMVRLELCGPLSPMKVLPLEGEHFLFLVLPMRLRAE